MNICQSADDGPNIEEEVVIDDIHVEIESGKFVVYLYSGLLIILVKRESSVPTERKGT